MGTEFIVHGYLSFEQRNMAEYVTNTLTRNPRKTKEGPEDST